jgi:hypothetical protein
MYWPEGLVSRREQQLRKNSYFCIPSCGGMVIRIYRVIAFLALETPQTLNCDFDNI